MRQVTTSSAILLVGISALALGMANAANATTLISDGFSGAAGTSINGRTPDTTDQPGTTWVEYGATGNAAGSASNLLSPDITVNGSGAAAFPISNVTPATDGTLTLTDFGASINFDANTTATGGLITVSATLNATDQVHEWLAIGLGPTSQFGPWAAGGGPWALLKSTGEVQAFASGGTGTLFADTKSTITGAIHTLELSYNPATTAVSLLVDGNAVTGVTGVTGGTYTYGGTGLAAPSIGSMFIDDRYEYTYGPVAGAPDYGSFSNVVVTGTPTPEPMTLALFGIGAMGMLLLRRKRAS